MGKGRALEEGRLAAEVERSMIQQDRDRSLMYYLKYVGLGRVQGSAGIDEAGGVESAESHRGWFAKTLSYCWLGFHAGDSSKATDDSSNPSRDV
jgi:hypothetical protein